MSDKAPSQPKDKERASSVELADLPPNNEQAVNVVGGLLYESSTPSPSPSPTPLPSPTPTPVPPLQPSNGGGTG